MLDVKETELLVKQFDDESDDAENSAVWESHANNIIIGIEANDDVRPVRAIWEMVQNARDERKQDTLANMVFTRRKDTFVFQHDGEPFSKNALSSLIIQTSSKNKNEPEKVGKYGTGFLTTHKFGRVFLLDGSLCLKTGLAYFHNFNGFEIDRSSEDKVELGKIIKNKIEETKSWNKKLDQISHKAAEFTTFTYKHRDAQECENAKEAFQEAPSLIPYVIALNKGIGSIELVDEVEGSSSLFVRKGEYSEIEINDDYRLVKCQIGITVNGDELPSESIFMLESNNEFTTDGEPRVTVILPIHQTHNAYKAFDLGYNVPRLFLHLPLLGTDNWALNFIIHAPKFTCDKENRDNVRFSGNSEETVKKAEANRELLKLASKIIMQFIDRNLQMIENSKEFAVVKFRLQDANEKTKDYFSEQQTWWVAQMESRKFVNCDERLPVAEIKVLDMDLLEACEKDVSLLDAIYYFFERAVEFAPIHPRKEEMLFWSHTINDWYEDKDNSHFLTDYHIADMISKMSVHESDLDQLYIFEKYLVDSNKSKVFDEKNILPNIDLMLCAREEMLDAVSFTDNVMDVLRTLSPDTILHLVHPKFAKLLKLDSYNYDSLKNTLANRINDLLNLQKDSEVKKDKELYRFDATKYADSFFTNEIAAAILKLNMMIIDEDSSSVEAKMLPYLREFYSYDEIEAMAASDRYCKFVCGSDQVWATTTLYPDPMMYLRFAPREKRVAYAPSLGRNYIPNYNRKTIKQYVNDIDSVSVREDSGRRLLKELTSRDIPVVADPTLLMRSQEWDALKADVELPEHYALCYFLDEPSQDVKDAICKYVQENNKKIVVLGHLDSIDIPEKDIVRPTAGPAEFLTITSKADMVITDSYHGMLFAINYHRKFWSVERNYNQYDQSSRQLTVLNRLHLEDRYVKKNYEFTDASIDYEYVQARIDEFVNYSLNYLKTALEK